MSNQGISQYLNEGFEGGALPAGWSQEFVSGTKFWAYQSGDAGVITTAHSGSFNAIFNNPSYTTRVTKLVTPALDLSAATLPQLTFWHAQDDYSGDQDELRVYYKTSAGASWTLIPAAIYTSVVSSWTKVTLSLPSPSATYYIAFEATGKFGYGVILDDIRVSDLITCPEPSNGTAANFTISSSDLNWTENGTAPLWNIELGVKGFTPTGTATHSGVTKPYTYSGLNASTSYDYYVQADCGSGNKSFWAGPFNFNTACTFISTIPWTEDFENDGDIPVCWENETTNSYDWQFLAADMNQGDHTTGAGYYSIMDAWDATTGDVSGLISPTFNLTSTSSPVLKFWWMRPNSSSNTAELRIDVYANGVWNLNVLPGLLQTNSFWAEETVYLSSYKYNDVRIRFNVNVANFSDQAFILDDVKIEESGLSCIPPSALSASTIMATIANLNWTENNSSTTWNLEYGPAGFTQGTGTTLTTSINPYPLTGLNATTTYDYYVQTNCGGAGTSTWSGPFSFTTKCNATGTFPWSEDFENAGSMPMCWENDPANGYDWNFMNYLYSGSGNFITDGHGDVLNGNQYFAVFDSYNSSTNDIGKLTSSPLNLSISTNPELHFWYNKPQYTDTSYIHFKVNINANGVWTYDVLPAIDASPASTSGWHEYTYSLAPYQSMNFVQLQFEIVCKNTNSSIIGLDDVGIIAGTTVGISDVDNFSYSNIYPNPSSGNFTIKTNLSGNENIQEVEIYNILGALIKRATALKSGNNLYSVNVSDIDAGMYYITYMVNSKKYSEKLIIK